MTPNRPPLPVGPLATSAIAALLLALGFIGLFGSIRSSLAPGLLEPGTAKALIAVGLLLEGWASFGLYQFVARKSARAAAPQPPAQRK